MYLTKNRLFAVLTSALLLASCEKDGNDDPPPSSPGSEPFWELPSIDSIVDAEYDKVHDRIIAVSQNPDQVMVIDPFEESITTIALNSDPSCISVAEDGLSAVVGHNGWVSWIDLGGLSLTNVHSAGCDVFDIVLGSNGYAYAFPKSDQWTEIFCIHLQTGDLTNSGSWSIYERTNARLKPGSTRIYGCTNNISPTDVETYDISNGTADYLYDSPYHGDYPMGGGIWFSESGDRLFTRDHTVLNTSMEQAQDMQYAGILSGDAHIRSMDHSAEADRVYSIDAWKDYELDWNGGVQVDTAINVYTGQFFDHLGAITLPRAWRNEGWHRFGGVFGAFDAAGEHFHVIMRTDIGDGGTMWAVTTISAEDPE